MIRDTSPLIILSVTGIIINDHREIGDVLFLHSRKEGCNNDQISSHFSVAGVGPCGDISSVGANCRGGALGSRVFSMSFLTCASKASSSKESLQHPPQHPAVLLPVQQPRLP